MAGYGLAVKHKHFIVWNDSQAPPRSTDDSNRENSAGLTSNGVLKTLVDSICAAIGLRPIPDAKQIKQFLDRCKNLDAGVMGGLIVAKLDRKTGK